MFKKIVGTIIVLGVVSGCSNSAPKCSDEKTINLVKQIAKEKLVASFGEKSANMIELSIGAIRTTDSNEKTGTQQCAAQLTMKGEGGSKSADFTYKVEKTDDGEEFFVTAYGL